MNWKTETKPKVSDYPSIYIYSFFVIKLSDFACSVGQEIWSMRMHMYSAVDHGNDMIMVQFVVKPAHHFYGLQEYRPWTIAASLLNKEHRNAHLLKNRCSFSNVNTAYLP